MLEVTLPYPPTINHYWGRKHRVVGGKVICQNYIKKEGVIFHEHVAWIFKLKGITRTLTKKVRVEMDVYPPDHRIRDIDNLFKALADSLQKCKVIANDNQIECILIAKCNVYKPKGKVVLRIREILSVEQRD